MPNQFEGLSTQLRREHVSRPDADACYISPAPSRCATNAIVLNCVHLRTLEVQYVSVNHNDHTPRTRA